MGVLNRISLCVVVAAVFVISAVTAYADPAINVTQSLRFGNIFTRDNLTVYGLQVSPAGTATPIGGGLILLGTGVQPRNGVFELTDFVPGDNLTITFDPAQVVLTCGCGGPSFLVDTFQISPSSVTIDGSGGAIIAFGATLKTDGSTLRYSGADYEGTVNISFTIDNI